MAPEVIEEVFLLQQNLEISDTSQVAHHIIS